MTLSPPSAQGAEPAERRFRIDDVSWAEYVTICEALWDKHPSLRVAYCEGAMELMSPIGDDHERLKKNIARFVELYALGRDVPLYAYGNMTFQNETALRAVEPDECYCVGRAKPRGALGPPDIAIEVVLTNPLLDKLAIYAGLGVREAWIFKRGAFHLHALHAGRYEPISRSELLPGIDFDVLARLVVRDDTHAALLEYRAALRAAAP
jgi:Uma2 family endonuclease